MIRTRLYLGMLPIVGILIMVCIFAANRISELNNQFQALQHGEYATVLDIEGLLHVTARIETSLNAPVDDPQTAAYREELRIWMTENENATDFQISQLAEEIDRFQEILQNVETSKSRDEFSAELLIALHESGRQIERTAEEILADRNREIAQKSESFLKQANTFYYVALSSIIGSIVAIGLVSYFLSQRFLAPIDNITKQLDRIADSNWEVDFEPNSKHEIAKLEIAFVAMAKRIREFQKIMSNKLVRTRRRMEECFQNFPHPIFFFNSHRTLVYSNESAKILSRDLRWKEEGMPKNLMARVESVLGTGEEFMTSDFDDTVTYFIDSSELHFLPLFIRIDSDEVDEIECALILQDITTLHLSDELKSDLVATVSHEIKTPVTSAGMALHIVLEESLGELNEDQSDMLQTAVNELKRLERLLNNLLQIARLESGNSNLNTIPCDPAEIVRNAIELCRTDAAAKNLQVTTHVEAGLPQVTIDPKAIDVAFTNLISNAIKFSDSGARIEIYAKTSNQGRILFGVLDEGTGIDEANMDKLFNKFYRSSSSVSTSGIGLGLSICKDIITVHGGTVACSNRPTKGADFRFELPAAEIGISS